MTSFVYLRVLRGSSICTSSTTKDTKVHKVHCGTARVEAPSWVGDLTKPRADYSMIPNPLALIAEITHRCPLHCVYCSNPLQMIGAKAELSTEDWVRVFQEARDLGILHLHLTGGEPVARADLRESGRSRTCCRTLYQPDHVGDWLARSATERRWSMRGSTTFNSVSRIHGTSRQTGLRARRRTHTKSFFRKSFAGSRLRSP